MNIPIEIRDMWFKEFEEEFYWQPNHHQNIRQIFEIRGVTCLQEILFDIRHRTENPSWIGEDVWTQLCVNWASPQQNQSSDYGSMSTSVHTRGSVSTSVHTRGSVPHTEHKGMKHILGREPTTTKLHTHTHQHQADRRCADPRSPRVFDEHMGPGPKNVRS